MTYIRLANVMQSGGREPVAPARLNADTSDAIRQLEVSCFFSKAAKRTQTATKRTVNQRPEGFPSGKLQVSGFGGGLNSSVLNTRNSSPGPAISSTSAT